MAATILNYVHAYLPDRVQVTGVIFPKGTEYCCHSGNNRKTHTPAKGDKVKVGKIRQKSNEKRKHTSHERQYHTPKFWAESQTLWSIDASCYISRRIP